MLTKLFGRNYFDRITDEELKYLTRWVELLREQVEISCQEKMKTFT